MQDGPLHPWRMHTIHHQNDACIIHNCTRAGESVGTRCRMLHKNWEKTRLPLSPPQRRLSLLRRGCWAPPAHKTQTLTLRCRLPPSCAAVWLIYWVFPPVFSQWQKVTLRPLQDSASTRSRCTQEGGAPRHRRVGGGDGPALASQWTTQNRKSRANATRDFFKFPSRHFVSFASAERLRLLLVSWTLSRVLYGSGLSLRLIFGVRLEIISNFPNNGEVCLSFMMGRAPNVTSTLQPIRREDGGRRRRPLNPSLANHAHSTLHCGGGRWRVFLSSQVPLGDGFCTLCAQDLQDLWEYKFVHKG